jgi:hypothetical protein
MTMVLVLANALFSVSHSNLLLGCALHQFFQRLAHSTWRAVGQAFLICLALGGCGATAQNDGPSREAFAEMVAFARLGSVACERLAPDAEGFHALALLTLVKPPLTKEEIAAARTPAQASGSTCYADTSTLLLLTIACCATICRRVC